MSVRLRDVVAGLAAALALTGSFSPAITAQSPVALAPGLLQEFAWRNVGPFRGGPAGTITGTQTQPNLLYLGTNGGGLWKTTDYGRTWRPLFDEQVTGSIGAVAVAPSSPNIIYVGTGEGIFGSRTTIGSGVFRSSDAGRTWTPLGLASSQQIARIAVDPRDPNRLLVAVPGRPYGPSAERGIFRSINAGRTFERILFRDDNTGGTDVVYDPTNSSTAYAVLVQARRTAADDAVESGPAGGLFKSTDAGTTWRQIGRGLPAPEGDGLKRIALAVAPTNSQRLFAAVGAHSRSGLYRSDDAGETWTILAGAPEVLREFDVGAVALDPSNPDVFYYAGQTAWKSSDGGRTFAAWRAAGAGPFRDVWINPANPNVVALAGDRGGVVSVNGGETWSVANAPMSLVSWVGADAAFPYRVCGTQPDGVVCASSRGSSGVDVGEAAPMVPGGGAVVTDPLDPDVMYAGAVTRYDRRTGQTQDVTPTRDTNYRLSRRPPLAFSPTDNRTLYFGSNMVWKTTSGGQLWTRVSPDLAPDVASGTAQGANLAAPRHAIAALGLSPIDARVIWAGTDDGRIHISRDAGANWTSVTPAALPASAAVSSIEPSHFDPNSAYAVVNSQSLDDLRPHIYRTRDGGLTWVEIVRGLPTGNPVNAVREDPARRGLLFAATNQSVFLAFDDGNSWQPLRLNLPPAPIQNLLVKDADLIVATAGRGFWILDDLMPLRQITDDVLKADAFLFRPAQAWRTNAESGVFLSYFLGQDVTAPVTLEIIESLSGEVLRRFSSDAAGPPAGTGNAVAADRLSTRAGLHRLLWDVRYAPPIGSPSVGASEPLPRGRWVLPGTYQVRLTVGGRALRQAVVVKMDPRVKTSLADLTYQGRLSKSVDDMIRQVSAARADVARRQPDVTSPDAAALPILAELNSSTNALVDVFETLQQADTRPTAAVEATTSAALARATAAIEAAR